MIDIINGKAYLKVGDKVYELGGGSNIITADSVEQLPDPASVPEGTIALVKSEGESGGGLPVVEIANIMAITEAESAQLTAAADKHLPCVITISMDGMISSVVAGFTYLGDVDGDNDAVYMAGEAQINRNKETGLWSLSGG